MSGFAATFARPSAKQAGQPRIDFWEILTGVFVLIFVSGGGYFSGSLVSYAQRVVTITIVCEFCMGLCALALPWAAREPEESKRRAKASIALGVYVVCVVGVALKAAAPWLALQALWILAGRFRPAAGIDAFAAQNIRRFIRVAIASFVLVVVHILLLAITAAVLDRFGVHQTYDGVVGAPMWLYGIVYGAFYFELAFLLPRVEKNRPAASQPAAETAQS